MGEDGRCGKTENTSERCVQPVQSRHVQGPVASIGAAIVVVVGVAWGIIERRRFKALERRIQKLEGKLEILAHDCALTASSRPWMDGDLKRYSSNPSGGGECTRKDGTAASSHAEAASNTGTAVTARRTYSAIVRDSAAGERGSMVGLTARILSEADEPCSLLFDEDQDEWSFNDPEEWLVRTYPPKGRIHNALEERNMPNIPKLDLNKCQVYADARSSAGTAPSC